MLCLQPREVQFGGEKWPDVAAVMIDRAAVRTVREWDDQGPFVRLVDAADVLVTVRVVQRLTRGALTAPAPGTQAALAFVTGPTAADAGRKRCEMTAVVTGVTHDLGRGGGWSAGGTALATRTITLVAVSSDGAADPVVITDASALP